MDPTVESAAPITPPRKGRAWWQWVIGIGLIGYAVFSLALRGVAKYRPEWLAAEPVFDPIPLEVPPGMKDGDVVPAAPGAYAGHNVLLVTLDTTRADRIGCYGNKAIKTPVMDRLAAEGILFSQAYAPNPTTLPSHASILTGLYPIRHGARANGIYRLSDESVTLAELFGQKGYTTGAAVSAFVLDARYGLRQGFADYDDNVRAFADPSRLHDPERRGGDTTDVALKWLEKNAGEKPFFYWIHYFDPHQPYEPIEQFAIDYAQMPYDGEIAYVDKQIGRLLELIEKKGLREKTLVVVVGDHGQGLGQHEEATHGFMVYDSTLQVPFIMACGKSFGGGLHVRRPVSSADIFPTVLTLCGIEKPEGLDAVDLTVAPQGPRKLWFDALEGFLGYGMAPLLSVRVGDLKYIWGPDPELYDLSKDPNELQDLADTKPDAVASLEKELKAYFGGDLAKAAMVDASFAMTEEEQNQLRALGYISDGISSAPQSGELPDPKSMMHIVRRAEAALIGLSMGDVQRSIDALNQIVDDYPDFYIGHKWLADCYLRLKDLNSMRDTLKNCIEVHPNVPYPYLVLARIAITNKDYEEAIFWYEQTLKIAEDHYTALSELGGLLLEMDRDHARAADLLSRAFAIRPDDQSVVEHMANAMMRVGRGEELIDNLLAQIKAKPQLAATRNAAARLLLRSKRCPEAIATLREGYTLNPDQDELANNLAYCIMQCTKPGSLPPLEAVVIAEKLCRKTGYKVPEYMRTLATVYGGFGRFDEAIVVSRQAAQVARDQSKTALAQLLDNLAVEYERLKVERQTPTSAPSSAPAARGNVESPSAAAGVGPNG